MGAISRVPMPEEDAAHHRAVAYWRTVLTRALSDCSTVDYLDLSEAEVDNLALVAARAVAAELKVP